MQTLAKPSPWTERRVKGSRFLACLAPAEGRKDVDRLLQTARARHPNATHYCYAYRLAGKSDGAPTEFGTDAGEPSGSAGTQLLKVLRRAKMVNVMLIVVRYFGGTKLGVPGLIAAYSGAAADALAEATAVDWVPMQSWTLEVPYTLVDQVKGTVRKLGGTVIDVQYVEGAVMKVQVPEAEGAVFRERLEAWASGGVVFSANLD